ncbi:hypothetical protein ACYSNW_06615 [Enterococcus sp. LJL99]
MLLGVMELLDKTDLHYYFVSLSMVDNNLLLLKTLPHDCKPFEKKVKLTEVQNAEIKKVKQALAVQFDYENNHYTFIDYGNHVVPFFEKMLLPVISSNY